MNRIEVNVLTGEQTIVALSPEEIVEVTARAAAQPPAYLSQRAAEYPPATDYLDAVVKSDQVAVDAYIAACKAVKAKYPKP